MKSFTKKLLVVLFATVLLCCQSVAVQAEEFNGFSISQMIIKGQGKPGETINQSFEIYNNTDKTAKVKVEVRDFELKDKQVIYKTDLPINYSVSKWSAISNQNVALAPQKSQKVSLDIKIPEEAEMGEHVALVAVGFVPEGAQGNVKIATELLPVMYVTVTDKNGNINLQKSWELLNTTADKVNGGPIELQVKNTGNVHLESTGSVTIRNWFTGSEEKIEIPLVNLLPKAEKTIQMEWLPKDTVGIYTADIQFSMDGERVEAQQMIFWALPGTMPIVIGVGGLVLVVALIRLYLVRLKRKMLQQAKQQVIAEMAPTSEESTFAGKE